MTRAPNGALNSRPHRSRRTASNGTATPVGLGHIGDIEFWAPEPWSSDHGRQRKHRSRRRVGVQRRRAGMSSPPCAAPATGASRGPARTNSGRSPTGGPGRRSESTATCRRWKTTPSATSRRQLRQAGSAHLLRDPRVPVDLIPADGRGGLPRSSRLLVRREPLARTADRLLPAALERADAGRRTVSAGRARGRRHGPVRRPDLRERHAARPPTASSSTRSNRPPCACSSPTSSECLRTGPRHAALRRRRVLLGARHSCTSAATKNSLWAAAGPSLKLPRRIRPRRRDGAALLQAPLQRRHSAVRRRRNTQPGSGPGPRNDARRSERVPRTRSSTRSPPSPAPTARGSR